MRRQALYGILICVSLSTTRILAGEPSDQILEMARHTFGEPLNAEHHVFPLSDTYVAWLVLDKNGNLFEIVVGPKSHYQSEFPGIKTPANPEYLSESDYHDALRKISELKNIGALTKGHGHAVWSRLGAFSTDHFENASVDRVVGDAPADLQSEPQRVRRFDLHFFEDISGSPKEVLTNSDNPMVCLGNEWYYLPVGYTQPIRLGKWQTLKLSGPSMYSTTCARTTPLYDADGFTIEEPVNELIVVDRPYKVHALAGHVHLGDDPLKGVNVEVKREGTRKVLRTKTLEDGTFKFSDAPEGRYKFKVTKGGFKALTGTIIVDRHAAKGNLSFELPVGT